MSRLVFTKPFTQQEPISEQAIEQAVAVLRSGRLHRYNTLGDEAGQAADLESAYATYQEADYCLALTSGGTAMQIALRACGVKPGDAVVTNAFTLAPVPGAIAAVSARPVFVETTVNLTVDLDDLDAKLEASGAKVFMLSHMRGHIAPMERLCEIVAKHGAVLIEDCAHTMGARWNGIRSGNFGTAACFSTQTYKHMNSGEGGFLTSNDPDLMARATVMSGSYMLYNRHGAGPSEPHFERARLEMPNCSSRMDNLRAAILTPQIETLDTNIDRWNARYRKLDDGLSGAANATLTERPQHEHYVGSSFQFLVPEDTSDEDARALVARCAQRGVELKWFGDANPVGFTSRYDSWEYAEAQTLPYTIKVLQRIMDLRVPLSFSEDDCGLIAQIIREELAGI
ncbi:MAG: aminotransferase class I/II-fold pyridoxal phosphate-dependent enzyme [Pseudomonadota bacterium]